MYPPETIMVFKINDIFQVGGQNSENSNYSQTLKEYSLLLGLGVGDLEIT